MWPQLIIYGRIKDFKFYFRVTQVYVAYFFSKDKSTLDKLIDLLKH
ncbi:CLUMA_CG021039, isoform A [Clunio marinus]|uniref:CLUMA_CG021039, isoform A n=1 Tax=Clunio marinus TaxID=568069 RepID=A0A1J1J7A8_9DIPT|nr:CLUMA_CG021039, isoform A [Clunio marinus]